MKIDLSGCWPDMELIGPIALPHFVSSRPGRDNGLKKDAKNANNYVFMNFYRCRKPKSGIDYVA